jgi:hypothetical protein
MNTRARTREPIPKTHQSDLKAQGKVPQGAAQGSYQVPSKLHAGPEPDRTVRVWGVASRRNKVKGKALSAKHADRGRPAQPAWGSLGAGRQVQFKRMAVAVVQSGGGVLETFSIQRHFVARDHRARPSLPIRRLVTQRNARSSEKRGNGVKSAVTTWVWPFARRCRTGD